MLNVNNETELEKLLDKYNHTFKEPFLEFYLRSWNEKELYEIVRECIKTDTPFNPYQRVDDPDALF